jgi:hypothetical protein
MKKAITMLLLVLFTASLTACATTKTETQRVKCPACGYEFDAPAPYK